LLWYIAMILLTSSLLSATAVLGLLGAQHGLEVRRERARESGDEYYRRGLVHLEEGNYLLALAEFEEAVRLAPDNSEAEEQLGLLLLLLGDEAVSSGTLSTEALLSLYGEASALYSQGDWGGAITRLEQLRLLDPDYRTEEVEAMLLDAYHRQSALLLEAGELEKTLILLERSLELNPNDSDAAGLRQLVSLYLDALSHWGADWDKAVINFRELYALDPGFMDVERRLHDALLNLGDLYYEEKAWCVAESRYSEALLILRSEDATAKRDEARGLCVRAIAEATPSVITSTVPMEPVMATVTAVAPPGAGTFVGQTVASEEADATAMRILVCVVDARGDGVSGTGVEVSAEAWRPDPKTTEGDGCCEFAGFTQEGEFTVALTELPCVPVEVVTSWGTETQVHFVER
jgi:tetratricopeptide (TPR) repeat protein